jgi:Gas vesicle synthesis protein GvpO
MADRGRRTSRSTSADEERPVRRTSADEERPVRRTSEDEERPEDRPVRLRDDGEDADRPVRRGRERPPAPAGRQAADGITAAQAARSGLRSVAELIGKQPEGVTAVEPTEDGWLVGVEVVADRRVPSSADILAVYEAALDAGGDLVSYRRLRSYPRGRGDDGGER